MLKQNWCFTGTDERGINMLEKKMLQQVMNESLFGFRDIISLDDFFFFSLFYICVFASSIVKSEHSVWPWLTHMTVTWSPVDRGASGILDVQSVCDPRVFLFDGCLLFPWPLSSTHLHVPLSLPTTLFQPSSWPKGEIKPALFIDFFSKKEKKKFYLASPVSRPPHWVIHTVNSPGYFGSSPQRLLFKRHQHFPFISPTVGSVLGRGSLFSISLWSFQWSVTYTCRKKKNLACY